MNAGLIDFESIESEADYMAQVYEDAIESSIADYSELLLDNFNSEVIDYEN